MIYMLVDERLPKTSTSQDKTEEPLEKLDGNILWAKLPEGPSDQQTNLVIDRVFEHLDQSSIDLFSDDFRASILVKKKYLEQCGEKTCDEFLRSNAYQGWKNRRSRGPSLLYAKGAGRFFQGDFKGNMTLSKLSTDTGTSRNR